MRRIHRARGKERSLEQEDPVLHGESRKKGGSCGLGEPDGPGERYRIPEQHLQANGKTRETLEGGSVRSGAVKFWNEEKLPYDWDGGSRSFKACRRGRVSRKKNRERGGPPFHPPGALKSREFRKKLQRPDSSLGGLAKSASLLKVLKFFKMKP